MHRLENAGIAAVLLLAFVADLRFVVPLVAVVLVVRAVLGRAELLARGIDVALLAGSSLSFLLGNEVAAWALALATAVLAGVEAGRPSARGRSAGAR